MEPVSLIAVGTLATVVMYAGNRGKQAVTGFYQRRVQGWRGSSPKPAPWGIKVGAWLATGAVGGFLYARGFVKGVIEGWPNGAEAAREWYAKRLSVEGQESASLGLCTACKFNLAKHGWPVQHQNRKGELCQYDWHTDPRWQRCPDCNAILIPGTTVCSDCEQLSARALRTKGRRVDAGGPKTTGPEQPAQRCRAKHGGKQCPNDADPMLGKGLCTKDDALAAAERPQTTRRAGRRTQMRLVADPAAEGKGDDNMITTATGGDVHNLEQILNELGTVVDEQTAEYDVAKQALAWYEAKLKAMQEMQHWLVGEEFPAPMLGRATDLLNALQGAVDAAKDRVAAAEHMLTNAGEATTRLMPHKQVQSAVHAAGGMAKRSGYAV